MKTSSILKTCALIAAAVTTQATTTITFNPLVGGNGAPYSGHNEAGFTVTPTAGSFFEAHIFGNPTPDVFAGPIGSVTTSTLQVQDSTFDPFTLVSVDLSSNSANSGSYKLEGFLGAVSVFSTVGGFSAVNTFETKLSTSSSPIDKLLITVIPGQGVTSMNIDNIVLDTAVTTPDAGTTAMLLGAAVAGLGIARRKLA